MAFKVFDIDLSATFSDRVIVEEGTRISSIAVTVFPSGAVLNWRVGNNPPFRIPSACSFDLSGDLHDDQTTARGLKLDNPNAQPGTSVQLVVFTTSNGAVSAVR